MGNKVSWFKWFMMIGTIGDEFEQAVKDDKKISFEEGLGIISSVAKAIGYEFDDTGSQLVVELMTKILAMASDGVVTISEIIAFTEELCNRLGIDFDRQGVVLG